MRTRENNSHENLVFGLRPIIELIQSGKEIDKILLQTGLQGSLFQELKSLLLKNKIPFQFVPVEKLNRVTRKNHQGAICYTSSISYQNIQAILPAVFEQGKIPLVLILDRVTDVRNFGAIARTAECSGVDAIIIPSKGNAMINADAIKTSAGALHNLPVCKEHNLKDSIKFLQESGLQVIACTEKTNQTIYQLDFTLPTAIVLGSEEDGISPEYIKLADGSAKIPLEGKTGSLNVSVAAGVIIFEAIRQRIK